MSKALSTVAGVVVIGAAAITGVAWYTGTQVEPQLRQQVTEANRQLKASLAGQAVTAQVEMTGFERHVFTSTAQYVATVQGPTFNGGAPLRVEALGTIEHGPFPWSRVKGLNLMPVLAVADYQVQSQPELSQWWGMAAGQAPLRLRAAVGYDRSVNATFAVLPAFWQASQGSVKFSGLEGNVEGTLDGHTLEMNARIGTLDLTNGGLERPGTLQLKDLSLHTGGIKGESGFYLGTNEAQVAYLRFISPDGPTLALSKLGFVGSLEELQGKLKGAMDYRVEQATIGNQPIGSLQMRWLFDQLDITATRELAAFYQNVITPQAQAAAQSNTPFEPRLTPEQEAQWQASLQRLLAGHPRLELAPLGLKTPNGESHLNLAVDFTQPANPNLPPEQQLQQLITRLDAKLLLAKGTVRDLATLQGQMQGATDPNTLAKYADSTANMIATLATFQGLAKVEGESILSALHYENGMVDFNGQKMTGEAFAAFVMSALQMR